MRKRDLSVEQAKAILETVWSMEKYLGRLLKALQIKDDSPSPQYLHDVNAAFEAVYNLRIKTFYESILRPIEQRDSNTNSLETNAKSDSKD